MNWYHPLYRFTDILKTYKDNKIMWVYKKFIYQMKKKRLSAKNISKWKLIRKIYCQLKLDFLNKLKKNPKKNSFTGKLGITKRVDYFQMTFQFFSVLWRHIWFNNFVQYIRVDIYYVIDRIKWCHPRWDWFEHFLVLARFCGFLHMLVLCFQRDIVSEPGVRPTFNFISSLIS